MSIIDAINMKDLNAQKSSWTPETLEEAANVCEKLRVTLLFDVDCAGADDESQEYFLLALADLEQANRHLRLARMHQTRAVARSQGHGG